jgi:hypothetical protein
MSLPWTWGTGGAHDSNCVIDTFDRSDGGMCVAAGNGIVAATPFENIEAFLDEAVVYGRPRRSQQA